MNNPLKKILINSTLAFIAAFFITTFIHEFGHFLSYLVFGANPILYHNYAQTDDQGLSLFVIVISALAGPVISLIQGIIFGIITSSEKKNKAVNLFFLWLCLLGFVNFFGYLLMTPLFTTGDTGKVAELLQLNYFYRILIAIIGFAILILLILKIGKNFSRFISVSPDNKLRKKYVYHIMFFPILIGSVINTLFAFPIPVIISAVYPATSSFVIMSSFGVILKSQPSHLSKTEIEESVSKLLVGLVLIGILINRLLTMGLST
jgi:hypothetical protein